jgi:crossover junction endodeoxyribonuclease RuvC
LRLLAFDPGTRVMGWAALRADGRTVALEAFGTHRPKDLADIARKVESLVRRHRPTEVIVERAFLAKNPRTFERLVEARAAIQIGARRPVRNYTPAEVKREIARFGRASKAQIQRSVRDLFGLRREPPADAADAIALGLCHISRNR